MLFLAIETSCDETSVAILQSDKTGRDIKLLSNVVSSQIELHAQWGGVVPNLAAREHLKNIVPVMEEALKKSGYKLSAIDVFAVTQGPGLIPALLIGTNTGKTLSYVQKKPLLGIHHIEGHILASTACENSKFQIPNFKFPLIVLVVSGGHTQLMLMKKMFDYEIIGQTWDDAVGEAFDKVAKILDLGYPGGPIVSKHAELFSKQLSELKDLKLKNQLEEISFPRPMISKPNFDFSFSGLKTSVMYFTRELEKKDLDPKTKELYKNAICHAFQESAIDVLVSKTIRAVKKHSPKTIVLAGGVAANKRLREELEKRISALDSNMGFLVPPLELCGDNAAMIGATAIKKYFALKEQGRLNELKDNWKTLEADTNMKLKNL